MKKLFALGLFLQLIAQISFSIHSETVDLLEPIDFIHWTLLIGIVLIIPYTLHFSTGLSYQIGVTVSLMGIVAQIGVCAIDFVLWTFRYENEERNDLVRHLMEEPMIWPIFFTAGPALLIIGLTIQAFGYYQQNLKGVMLATIGSALLGFGNFILPGNRLVFVSGYLIFILGLLLIIFYEKSSVQGT
ncbi:MAG: hypothetical protein F6K19_28000 [Cyanothece sp. SIO1E1]|nr:hypothetical protein [Cyanothece sp. SIO1E1]